MKKMLIGGIAAALAAGAGGGVWWMASGNRDVPAEPGMATAVAAPTPASEPLAQPQPAPDPQILAQAGTGAAGPTVVAATKPVVQTTFGAADFLSIERGVCFGPCPIYKATAYGDERLVFEGRKFVKANGINERRLAVGGFARLIDIARSYDFAAIDSRWPDERGFNCPEAPTDMPTVTIAISAAEIRHSVSFYEGCRFADGGERVTAMLAEIDKALALDEWIGPRGDWYGKRQKP